jgi:hypothetical protein
MSDEIVKVPEVEPEFKTTLTPEQLAAAEAEVKSRPFSARNPELGRMIKCQVCGLRHRSVQKCEQKFTNRAGDFEYFHEEEIDGEVKLVPTLRTAIPHDEKPTRKQIMGAAATHKKRFHPHHSKMKLLFIERTRKVFLALGFNADCDKETFDKNLQRARVVAARQIRKERRQSSRRVRLEQRASRRANRG